MIDMTKVLSAGALAITLSLSGLAQAASHAPVTVGDDPPAKTEKGKEHSCGAGSCGAKKMPDTKKDEAKPSRPSTTASTPRPPPKQPASRQTSSRSCSIAPPASASSFGR